MLDASEAALLFGLTREQVVRAVQKGKILGQLVEGRYRIDRASLEKWREEAQQLSAPKRLAGQQ
jgi:excisionase family DNA binding protein